jgi:hypothetical protein
MEDKSPPRLDRATMMHCAVGRLSGVDLQLLQQRSKPHPGALLAYADPDRAVLVMDANRNHCPLEARIGHPGHGKEKLARKETRLVHSLALSRRAAARKP